MFSFLKNLSKTRERERERERDPFNPHPTKPQNVFKLLKEVHGHDFISTQDCLPGNSENVKGRFRGGLSGTFVGIIQFLCFWVRPEASFRHRGNDHYCAITVRHEGGFGYTYSSSCKHLGHFEDKTKA